MKRIGQQSPINPNDHKHRDTSYDDNSRMGAPASVYSSQCAIPIIREVAAYYCCGNVTEIINHYCPTCRACGANEWQCMNPGSI